MSPRVSVDDALRLKLKQTFDVWPSTMQMEEILDVVFDALVVPAATDGMSEAYWHAMGTPTSRWRALARAAKESK